MQILTREQVKDYKWDILDITKVDLDLDSLDEMKKEVALETNFKILNQRLDFSIYAAIVWQRKFNIFFCH